MSLNSVARHKPDYAPQEASAGDMLLERSDLTDMYDDLSNFPTVCLS